jgi:uncharacterized phage-associated protein
MIVYASINNHGISEVINRTSINNQLSNLEKTKINQRVVNTLNYTKCFTLVKRRCPFYSLNLVHVM